MKPTFKAIARAAGYFAWQLSPGANAANMWLWKDMNGWGNEDYDKPHDSEEAAYRDCCIKCGLVEIDKGWQGGPR